jgi:hypothetical protein
MYPPAALFPTGEASPRHVSFVLALAPQIRLECQEAQAKDLMIVGSYEVRLKRLKVRSFL